MGVEIKRRELGSFIDLAGLIGNCEVERGKIGERRDGDDVHLTMSGFVESVEFGAPNIRIGVYGCARLPLHGDVVVEVCGRADLETTFVRKLLDCFGVTVGEGKAWVKLPERRVSQGEICPSSLELVTDEFGNRLMEVLGIRERDAKLSYADTKVRHLLTAGLMACIDKRLIDGKFGVDFEWNESRNRAVEVVDSDTYTPEYASPKYLYQVKLHKSGLGVYQCGLKTEELKEELGEGDYSAYDTKGFLGKFPQLTFSLGVTPVRLRCATRNVLPYDEFDQGLMRLASEFLVVRMDDDLSAVDVPRYLVKAEGQTVEIFFEKGGRECEYHAHRESCSMADREWQDGRDAIRYMRVLGYNAEEVNRTPGDVFNASMGYRPWADVVCRTYPEMRGRFDGAARVCDLGSGYGASTLFAADLCPNAMITTVDDRKGPFFEVLNAIGKRYKTHIKCEIGEFLRGNKETFDVIFVVKSSHTLRDSDCEYLARCVARGGYVFQIDGDIELPREMYKYFNPIYISSDGMEDVLWEKK